MQQGFDQMRMTAVLSQQQQGRGNGDVSHACSFFVLFNNRSSYE
jgi:hypothetical protein